jgi:hypothetical protein
VLANNALEPTVRSCRWRAAAQRERWADGTQNDTLETLHRNEEIVMAGSVTANFHEGSRSELLADYLFSTWVRSLRSAVRTITASTCIALLQIALVSEQLLQITMQSK